MRHICASEYLNVFVVFECVEFYHCVALQMPILIKTNIMCCESVFRPLWWFASRSVTSLQLRFKSTHIPPEFGGLLHLLSSEE